ncbi:hypothetical protein [Thalassospira alkalitolerans]|uniref:hypothetical protein n=1 Tax=Thalassospira alkalitolerans TaxID=1293890 RepID=UPI003AA94777
MIKLHSTIQNNRLISGHFGDIMFGDWGFECSDRQSFVTLSQTCRNATRSDDDWHLAEGHWHLRYQTTRQSHNTIRIRAKLTAITDGILQDAVIRLVFNKSAIIAGEIAGQRYRHTDSDRYRLHPVTTAKLRGENGTTITVTLDKVDGAGRFAPYLYLRDRGDCWIIHARLLPVDPVDHIWLRWANRFFTSAAPDWLARLIWNCHGGKRLLWRLRERLGRHCPEIQAVPLNRLRAGQVLKLGVTCHFQ